MEIQLYGIVIKVNEFILRQVEKKYGDRSYQSRLKYIKEMIILHNNHIEYPEEINNENLDTLFDGYCKNNMYEHVDLHEAIKANKIGNVELDDMCTFIWKQGRFGYLYTYHHSSYLIRNTKYMIITGDVHSQTNILAYRDLQKLNNYVVKYSLSDLEPKLYKFSYDDNFPRTARNLGVEFEDSIKL